MSRYDGLIIPRSYSEYINKTDAATLQQALQLSGVLSGAVAAGDNKAVKSSAVNNALKDYPKIAKKYNVNIKITTDKVFKILTFRQTDKGGAIIRLDFASRFGNTGFGSGSLFTSFNYFFGSSVWVLGKTSPNHAYFRVTQDITDNHIYYLEFVTIGGPNRNLIGTMNISVLDIYAAEIIYNDFTEQTNSVSIIDSTENRIVKINDLANCSFTVSGNKLIIQNSSYKWEFTGSAK